MHKDSGRLSALAKLEKLAEVSPSPGKNRTTLAILLVDGGLMTGLRPLGKFEASGIVLFAMLSQDWTSMSGNVAFVPA